MFREMIEDNKKALILVGVGIVIAIVLTISTSLISKKPKTLTPKQALEALGKIYYEENWHPSVVSELPNSYESFIEDYYATDGIKIDVGDFFNLYPDTDFKIFYNPEKKIVCNFQETYINIYPKMPYGKENYSINVVLQCDSNYHTEEE